jgi:hypothetical protein
MKKAIESEMLSFLTKQCGFHIEEERYEGKAMGSGFTTLASELLKIRFVNDRGWIGILVAGVGYPDCWIGIEFLRAIINKDDLRGPENLHESYEFIKNNLLVISDLLGKDKCTETTRKVDELGRARWERQFPGSTLG